MAILSVGPGQQFTTIAAAVGASNSGDIINVQAGTYTNDFFYIGHSLTLQAIGGVAKIIATQSAPNGKAIITEGVPGANVAFSRTAGSVLMRPMQFGPTSRTPARRIFSTSSSSRAWPAAPVSLGLSAARIRLFS